MSASWKQLFLQVFVLLVTCRHINTKTTGPTPPPPPVAPINPLPTEVRNVVLKGESQTEKVELLNAVNLSLECTWTGNLNKLPNISGYWKKNGNEIENSRVTVLMENEQYNLKQMFTIVSKENLGNYSCMFGNEAKIDFILAGPQIGEVRDKPIVSYMGDSVVIACKMGESKPKPLSWNWYKENGTDIEQIVAAESRRYEIKMEKGETKLVVRNVTDMDAGWYHCEAVYAISTTMGRVELRVITLWEPLKPFIAIVVEVIVLVAAILLYERSQSKKKCEGNETHAEQTSTLTQGENNGSEGSSSMRQRKV